MFGYHGATTVPEAHSLLKNKKVTFKKAIVYSGLITMVVYALFTLVTIGVLGKETTEIATIGLGKHLGSSMLWFGNLFALLAMGTSFLMTGVALRDSFVWDMHISEKKSVLLTLIVPTILFGIGVREFIAVLDIIGGVLITSEMFLIILIYWRAKQMGTLPVGKYQLHHTALLIACLLVALAVGAIYSVYNLF